MVGRIVALWALRKLEPYTVGAGDVTPMSVAANGGRLERLQGPGVKNQEQDEEQGCSYPEAHLQRTFPDRAAQKEHEGREEAHESSGRDSSVCAPECGDFALVRLDPLLMEMQRQHGRT